MLQDGGKTLVVAIPQATVQLDPAVAGSNGYGDIIPLADNITEGLTRFKNGGVEIEQALSDGWDISEDGTGYLFHIRAGVTFHDGTPLDAKAVETNFLRQMDREQPAPPRHHGLRRHRLRRRQERRGGRRDAERRHDQAFRRSCRATWPSSPPASSARPRWRRKGPSSGRRRSAPVPSSSRAGPRTSSWCSSPTTTTGVVDPRSIASSGARSATIRSASPSCRRGRSTSPTRSTSRMRRRSRATPTCS